MRLLSKEREWALQAQFVEFCHHFMVVHALTPSWGHPDLQLIWHSDFHLRQSCERWECGRKRLEIALWFIQLREQQHNHPFPIGCRRWESHLKLRVTFPHTWDSLETLTKCLLTKDQRSFRGNLRATLCFISQWLIIESSHLLVSDGGKVSIPWQGYKHGWEKSKHQTFDSNVEEVAWPCCGPQSLIKAGRLDGALRGLSHPPPPKLKWL